MSGHLTSVMPGASWSVRCDAVSAAAGPKFVPPESPWPSFDNARQFGKCGYVKVRNQREGVRSAGGSDERPDFTLRDLAGESTTLSALHGKAVLLDFWGTYCGPCKEEMPSIERLQEEYRDKGLEVWGVTDDSKEKAQKFLTDNHRALPTLIDQGRSVFFKKYEIKGIPVLVLIDRDGKVAKFWDGMQYEKDIRTALEPVLQ